MKETLLLACQMQRKKNIFLLVQFIVILKNKQTLSGSTHTHTHTLSHTVCLLTYLSGVSKHHVCCNSTYCCFADRLEKFTG